VDFHSDGGKLPDRTRDAVKRRASNLRRLHRFRARKRAEREAARKAARAARRIELDAIRASKGLPPAMTPAQKVAAWRKRRAALKEMIRLSWFGPPLDPAELAARIAAEHNGDFSYARERVEQFKYACRVAGFNLNEFVVKNYTLAAMLQRVLFHEATEAGMSALEAIEHAKMGRFVPQGDTDIKRLLNKQERFAAAEQRWHEGQEIIAALTGKPEPQE